MKNKISKPKVVLITGCSTGIGRDLAEQMSSAGYTVVATARRIEALETVKAKLKLQMDVTSEESINNALAQVIKIYGRVDVLVNNAGYANCCAVEELTDNEVRSMFEVNVFGVIRLMRVVIPIMRMHEEGTIVNISSIAGRMSIPLNGCYSGTKFAVEGLTDAARQELKPFGIKVILIQPGNTRTQFLETLRAQSKSILTNTESPYFTLYKRNSILTDNMISEGPEVVSQVILKALTDKKPKTRYLAAVPLLLRFLLRVGVSTRDRILDEALKKAK